MNINRRNFFKTSGIGIASAALLPTTSLIAQEPTIPLYKQFEWVDTPIFLMFKHNKEKNKLESVPFIVKSLRTKICSTIDIDLTHGQIITRENAHIVDECLYKEAKMNGLTHLYSIGTGGFVVNNELTQTHRIYYIRGAKVPPEYSYINVKYFTCKIQLY
jgi:hypothetical protein